MADPSDRWHPLARAEEIEYDRVVFFSDAVFAIAITLLVVDLQVPNVPHLDSARQLRESLPQMAGFTISFVVIGLFWIAHHGLFRYIKGLNRRLIMLNLLFLGCIAFLPYPTWLVSAAGDQVPATLFYAASIIAAGVPAFGEGLTRLVEGLRASGLIHPRAALVRHVFQRHARGSMWAAFTPRRGLEPGRPVISALDLGFEA